MIHIINYGIGNLGSVQNMFKKVGVPAKISSDLQEIREAKKLFLPGVGHFDACMKALNQSGLRSTVEEKVLGEKVPIMGICVGFQMMTQRSEEGNAEGLGYFDAETIKFNFSEAEAREKKLKVPHMGWNYVNLKKDSSLVTNLNEKTRFYFVHSYYVKANDASQVLMTTNYGLEFASAMVKGNIFGCQFHGEKSHKYGMQLFKNFAEFTP
jgi:glutamine amidotransferase